MATRNNQPASKNAKPSERSEYGASGASQAPGVTPQWVEQRMSDIIKGTEERFESKLELLKSSLSGDLAKLDNVPTTTTLVLAVIGGVVTGMGLVLALLAYGNDRFSTGSQFTMGTYEQSAAALKASEDAKRLSDDLSRDVRALTDAVRRAMDRQEAPRDVPRQTPQP